MRIAHDLTGKKLGRLTVIERVPSRGRTRWACVCECGAQTIVATDSLIAKKRPTRSCGCLGREAAKARYAAARAAAAAERGRLRAVYGEQQDKPTGYCEKPTRVLRVRLDAVRELASALGFTAPQFRERDKRVHWLEDGRPA